ncbi:hypothetical protein KR51_00001370 [Rubidibacter lacunae KORDI 51-2]|uniref:PhnB-like domain-containing protein n=1 Tax=Rubidibacter lacunae KORDI 51-2 TaxID=582515 RepID=U5DQG4_9CHRO|nr:VOC family protein [Rubidibacter lacunae]ERN43077.1 hypothetical protein KR51_00001370 [Rubidibacter lacunae KORDI 51-2]
MLVLPSLSFYGRTEEALEFYRDALGAETTFLMRFADSPLAKETEASDRQLIFHATFRINETKFMATDVGYDDPDTDVSGSRVSFVLRLDSVQRATEMFEALADDGHIVLPLASSGFTSLYGVVTDRFGLSWKINVDKEGR